MMAAIHGRCFLCHNLRLLCQIFPLYSRGGAKFTPHQISAIPNFARPQSPHPHPALAGTDFNTEGVHLHTHCFHSTRSLAFRSQLMETATPHKPLT